MPYLLAYFYVLDTLIEIRRALPSFVVVSCVKASLFSGSAAPSSCLELETQRWRHEQHRCYGDSLAAAAVAR